jgi:hypothetical protein
LLALLAPPLFGAVTIVNGTYSDINPTSRQYRVYYSTGTPVSTKLPVVVFIHGGGWWKGDLGDDSMTPTVCDNTLTVGCWLAENGYVVWSINYTLVSAIQSGDLIISSANTVKSSAYPFTAADVGSALVVVQSNAAGWNPGGYTVQSVTDSVATLSGSPGTIGLQGGMFDKVSQSTMWPAQWQDCNCFLRYLAENLGVTVPGDPNNIFLMGHSAGGQLVGVLGLAGNGAFQTNCEHTSTSYTIRGIMAASPPTDLVSLYTESMSAQSDIRGLLGCIPGYGATCNQLAYSASAIDYIAENLPPYIAFSGDDDGGIPPINAQEASLDFAKLVPAVYSQWVELSPNFYHDLDLFYYDPCSSDPDGSEPSPCGSAGTTFGDMLAFMTPLETYPAALTITSGNNQSVAAGGTLASPMVVSVTNQYGQALSGATVTFTVYPGTTGESGNFSGAIVSTSVSNASGLATAPALTVNSSAGLFTVTASVLSLSATFSLTISPVSSPVTVTIAAGNTQSIGAGAPARTALAVSVTNQSGQPLTGQTVMFTVNTGVSGASGTFNASSSVSVLSGSNGLATAPALTANLLAGPFSVTASTGGVSTNFALTITPLPSPTTLTIVSGNYQSISPGLNATTVLAVSLLDQYGNPFPGATVTFTVNSGASGQGGSFNGSGAVAVPTGGNGVATASALTVTSSAGPFSVTASAGILSAVFSLNIGPLEVPFGYVDTPVNNTNGIVGAVNVTGWALSPVGLQTVAIWRDPVLGEGPNMIFLVNATIVPGARPDIAKSFPGYPCDNCGWGAQILTNELPNATGEGGLGNGTFNLHVLVTDNTGQTADLGTTAFSSANSGSVIPFGTIDTPAQGETVSGTYLNFGWALTPQPDLIPVDGSTITVYVDSVPVGHPVYNNYRVDIATLFPGLQNSSGAVGYFYLDTTTLTNGLHTLAWSVTDNAGHATGIGSRLFNVKN